MATEVTDIHEQSERARQWFQQNGFSVLIGIAAALALIFGYQSWQQRQQTQRIMASTIYQQAADAHQKEDFELQGRLVQSLKDNHGNTVHAVLGALLQAKTFADKDELEAAETELRFAVDKARSAELRDLARLRLALVQTARGNHAAALATLAAVQSTGYRALVAEQRGDIHRLDGKVSEARAAYADALTQLEVGAPGRELLQQKLDSLGGSDA
ncbi:MAG: tetratricopeptide repeat protein [Xanthomonadales bacterium]|jgi:predicted negative regulator of RcsB-dependent stress response|nr:tetratricopeptide repeat protein [Xanthomonadales bacterium]